MKKPPIYIISGKSPLKDSGGYPAYAYNLSRILTSLKFPVHTFAIRDEAASNKTSFGTIHFVSTRLVRIFPMLKHLALAGLPYYSIIIYHAMRKTLEEQQTKECIVWGMGPWTFPGVLLKFFPPPNVRVHVIANYFTSTRHEMKGALRAIHVRDYGLIPKIKYYFVYEVVARMFHLFEWVALYGCNLVVVHYNSSKKIVQKYFGVADKKIVTFPWYVDIFPRDTDVNTKQLTYRHPLIVSICRQDPRKGLNFLIRAMIPISQKYPDSQCLIIGSGEFLSHNKKLVEKLGLEKNVSVIGFVADIRPILKAADIAVIVPLAQGSSALTVLEAMSYGKAIVGSECDGIPEDITNDVSGLIISPGDEKPVARALDKLISNTKLRKRLSHGAFSAYKKRFGLEAMTKNIEETLRTTLSLPPRL